MRVARMRSPNLFDGFVPFPTSVTLCEESADLVLLLVRLKFLLEQIFSSMSAKNRVSVLMYTYKTTCKFKFEFERERLACYGFACIVLKTHPPLPSDSPAISFVELTTT